MGNTGSKLVVITFDDGFQDFLTAAWPVLSELGATATVFLPTSFIGDESKQFLGRSCLTWPEVRELQSLGVEFGSHTMTHRKLDRLSADELDQEIRWSKGLIEDRIGAPVQSFAYPFAFPEADAEFQRRSREMLKKHRYRLAVTTRIGVAKIGDDRLTLRRVPVNSDDDLPLLAAKLAGHYDWLHGVQYTAKLLKSRFAP